MYRPPSIADCMELMEQHAMLPNIRDHSFVVMQVAVAVLSRIAARGGPHPLPDRDLVVAGALLHDIAKTPCLHDNGDHASRGSAICLDLGHPQIAEIVEEHVRLRVFASERYRQGIFQAKEIIFYADKRVMHDKVVSLDERLEYILERYGNNDPQRHALIRVNFGRCQDLENWLCQAAGCTPADLLGDMAAAERQ